MSGRNGNRHRRSQSSPLNLPVDIPEVSSGDEVGSPTTKARNHDKLIKDVSPQHLMHACNMARVPCFDLGSTIWSHTPKATHICAYINLMQVLTSHAWAGA